jgi:hypothetical protein
VPAAQLLGQPREPVRTPRDEDEVVAVRREQARKLQTYAAGRTRDERRQLPPARCRLPFAHRTTEEKSEVRTLNSELKTERQLSIVQPSDF